ncbi:MAG: RNA polymerase sigma factor [Prevotella sp.]|mgnify:CR=1 FL=1|jgi:RNA polymerase sigma-70 factor (ECF subfamily)|nr:RNA polymerase sigma factor [Prevotella sp.]
MASLTDISLVAQVAISGNRRAFDELVRRYQSPVRRFFLHQTLGDSQLSDDLSQDTFVKAYTNIASFRGLASFQTWIMRIAYNVYYDYKRKKNLECGMLNEEWSALPMTNDKFSISHSSSQQSANHSSFVTQQSTLKMDIYAALALLKPDERTCITLQLIDGYDIAAIAKITQIKEGTVKSHLSRGKEKLANYLRQNGYDRR